jgi:hypothetical protein
MYYGLFQNDQDVCKEFSISEVGGTIIFAAYEYEDYSGSAEVVFVSKGKFYHVSGGHCSCYGLEGQWEPEEMPLVALRHIGEKSSSGMLSQMRNEFLGSLDAVLNRLGYDDTVEEDVLAFALRLAYS